MFVIFQVDLSSAQPIEVSVCVLRFNCFCTDYATEELLLTQKGFLSLFGALQLWCLVNFF